VRRRDLFLAAGAATFVSCGKKRPTGFQAIDVGVTNYPAISPFYVALERGYFREAGIDARPQMVARTGDIMALLAAGRLDAALGAIGPPIFNVAARGSDVRMVLGREMVKLNCGAAGALYARRSAFPQGTSDIRLWSGKTISTGLGAGIGDFLLDTALSRSGMEPKQVSRSPMNLYQASAALVSGSIDGILNPVNAPIDFGSSAGIVREDAARSLLANMQLSHILFGPGMLKRELSLGSRFLACYLCGVKDFEAGVTPQFLKDFAATQGGAQGVLKQCRTFSTPGGAIDRASIGLAGDWAASRGYAPAGVSVDSVVDERYLGPAQKEAGWTA
jgi:hypothetical protein